MIKKESFLTALSYIVFIRGLLHLVAGILFLFYDFLAVLNISLGLNIDFLETSSFKILIQFLSGFLYIQCSKGLNFRKKWGWILAVCVLLVELLFALSGIYRNVYFMNCPVKWIFCNSLIVLVCLLFLFLFFQKDIRQLFTKK